MATYDSRDIYGPRTCLSPQDIPQPCADPKCPVHGERPAHGRAMPVTAAMPRFGNAPVRQPGNASTTVPLRLVLGLSILGGSALLGSAMYGLGSAFAPVVAFLWMLGGIFVGAALGLAGYALTCVSLGVLRNQPPAEFTGMSPEQRRTMREHERRRQRRGVTID